MDKEAKRIITKHQGEIEENLKVYSGKKAADLSKEDVFAYMKYKAQWEILSEIAGEIK